VYPLKRNILTKQATLLFIIVFTLIKISPYYFLYQYIPRIQNNNSSEFYKAGVNKDNPNFLIKVDKSIIDKVDAHTVPPIKFSGISFSAFFGSPVLIPLNKLLTSISNNYILSLEKICITQCVLRL